MALKYTLLLLFLPLLLLYGCDTPSNTTPTEQSTDSQKKELTDKKRKKEGKKAQRQRAKKKSQEQARQKKRKSKQKKSATGKKTAPALLAKLPVRAESRSGYDRDLFAHWSDLDGDGCDTRDEVLARNGSSCSNLSGRWFSVYDGERTRDPSTFDVDHMVPLAEAWDSGARRWSASKRELYANDTYRYSLIAVSASSNREKSDADPREWLPPRSSWICRYVARWIAVKYRWRLSVDSGEKKSLRQEMRQCRKKDLRVKPKRWKKK